ncbi:G-rich domain on putative tyrosine kinase [Ekhidna lutea]|uniref:G-rich domain on putative tyrosine kinase n=1 Tax=Ekhidna lutea TaxID=447679 RepID=A0A239FFY3_EKHLU|nr:GNVR domain-containing protein [Ekhidna lutea]SNS55665.1 G-rich domain on putative tyrosine kinase [Ekhidna lutea]
MSSKETQIVTLPEFSISRFLTFCLTKKVKIVFIVLISTLLGLIIALTTPDEFTSNTILLPETSSGTEFSSIKGLAGLAGINLAEDSDGGINPEIYPQILNSTPFTTSLLKQVFYFQDLGDSITLYDFFTEHQKTSLFSKIIQLPMSVLKAIKGESEQLIIHAESDFVSLNKSQIEAIEELKSRIMMSVDINTGLITISCKMQDPLVVAEVTKFTLNYVSEYVKSYYTQKELVNLDFIRERHAEARKEFEAAQVALASFRDSNRLFGRESARVEEQRLQAEFDIKYNVYNNLTQQLEESKIAVQKKNPVYTILEPIKIPLEAAEPQRLVILIFSFVFGVFLSVGIYLISFIYGMDKKL